MATVTFRLGGGSHSSAHLPRPYQERVRAVSYAAMAYWYYRWDWGESIAIDGIDLAASDDALASGWVDREVDEWVRRCVEDGDPVSPMGPIWAVVRRVVAGDWPFADHGESLVQSAIEDVMSAATTSGALTPEKDGANVYVDSLYGLPVAFAAYALHTANDDLLSWVISLTEHHLDLLQDHETGLLAHYAMVDGTGPGIWWGRGNGWGALGLADLVLTIGVDHSPRLTERLELLLSGLIGHQSRSGEWRNLIAEEHSYPETSTTAMVTAALAIARDLTRGTEAWERGWDAVAHRIDTSGHVTGVSYRPGVNTDPSRYEHTPTFGSYPWGQGAWLRAAAAAS